MRKDTYKYYVLGWVQESELNAAEADLCARLEAMNQKVRLEEGVGVC